MWVGVAVGGCTCACVCLCVSVCACVCVVGCSLIRLVAWGFECLVLVEGK